MDTMIFTCRRYPKYEFDIREIDKITIVTNSECTYLELYSRGNKYALPIDQELFFNGDYKIRLVGADYLLDRVYDTVYLNKIYFVKVKGKYLICVEQIGGLRSYYNRLYNIQIEER